MTAGAGTTLWLSPEVIAGRRDYDQRTDVFSFGVLLSELDTHELPYFDARDGNGERMLDIMVAKKIVDDHLTPTFLPSCPRPVLELARRCLSFNPRERPAAAEILFRLDQVKQGDF
ncbi:TPA: hypothetical protein N0F65_003223 [Lagenidium giganteum]|uniref:Protein kinase domain-containing protein n=1 Tax=Lagenidium giganteum TaxID=4803 RepID=A0AAV2ZET3_9STRA|nr:TPA: hypothetical protein N0F65_003223 [Lagenidium giganteum]